MGHSPIGVVFSFIPFLLFSLTFIDEFLLSLRVALFFHVFWPIINVDNIRYFKSYGTSQVFFEESLFFLALVFLNKLSLLFDTLNILISFTARMSGTSRSLLSGHRLLNEDVFITANVL